MISSNELRLELKKNIRLRIGLWLILAIIAIYSLLLLNEYEMRLQAQYETRIAHLARLQDVTSQAEWIQREKQANSAKIMLENKLWTAVSKGLAQADFQAWLAGQIQAAKIQEPKMLVDEAKDVPTNIWLVKAKLEGIFETDALQRLLLNFAQHSQWVVVDSFEVRQSNRKPRFTLLMSVYFQASVSS